MRRPTQFGDGESSNAQEVITRVALCATALAGLSAGPAFAGEVKGPPGTGPVTGGSQNFTGAFTHSHSACAFNGLNDYDPLEGQTEFHVQSYGIDVAGLTSEEPFGHPGEDCRGGSGPAG
jgi:hypothetical protein